MLDLSVVIVAFNEERIIGKTLEAVFPFAGEIILVDSGSTDKTLEIARQFKVQCHHQQWLGYAAQKNYALSLATKKWILSLDADEIVTEALAKEITSILTKEQRFDEAGNSLSGKTVGPYYVGYKIPRLLYIGDFPLKHGGFYPDAQLRLFQNGKGKFIERKVHESVQIDGPIGKLQSPVLHYSYTDFGNYASTLDRYAQLSAQEFADRNGQLSKLKKYWRISKLNEVLHPIWTFCYRYFVRGGFLDGVNGLKANLIYQDYVRKKITYLRQLR